jgi:hypothetical protein
MIVVLPVVFDGYFVGTAFDRRHLDVRLAVAGEQSVGTLRVSRRLVPARPVTFIRLNNSNKSKY